MRKQALLTAGCAAGQTTEQHAPVITEWDLAMESTEARSNELHVFVFKSNAGGPVQTTLDDLT